MRSGRRFFTSPPRLFPSRVAPATRAKWTFEICVSQEQDACADAEDRAAQFQKEKEKLEEQVKVRRENK